MLLGVGGDGAGGRDGPDALAPDDPRVVALHLLHVGYGANLGEEVEQREEAPLLVSCRAEQEAVHD